MPFRMEVVNLAGQGSLVHDGPGSAGHMEPGQVAAQSPSCGLLCWHSCCSGHVHGANNKVRSVLLVRKQELSPDGTSEGSAAHRHTYKFCRPCRHRQLPLLRVCSDLLSTSQSESSRHCCVFLQAVLAFSGHCCLWAPPSEHHLAEGSQPAAAPGSDKPYNFPGTLLLHVCQTGISLACIDSFS